MSSSTVYQIVTDEIIKKLEAGCVPWRKPWVSAMGAARNLISGKPYRGINAFLLSCSPFSSPFWVTFKQALETGGNVRKGEKSSIAVFFKDWEVERENADGDMTIAKIPVLRFYHVFNSEQCEKIDHKRLAEMQAEAANAPTFDPIAEAEAIVSGMPNAPTIAEDSQRAYYRPSTDSVHMPKRTMFSAIAEFYSTLFHELGHATGHASRLARKGIVEAHGFGSDDYGQEELVAEMTAAFLCGEARISPPVIDNQAAYLANWLKAIRKDSKMLVFAAGQAQKAADFILGKGAPQHEAAL
jgi:antirestriction protein ArdC